MIEKKFILKLNKSFVPIDIESPEQVFPDLFKGSLFGIDIDYQIIDGEPDYNQIESFDVVYNWEDWTKLEIRDWEFSLKTPSGEIRIPNVVICKDFADLPARKRAKNPTKRNIWKRDEYIDQYTGQKLDKDRLSVDHVIPSSRGGKTEWSNLVTCDKALNSWKGDSLPEECGLKLIREPKNPHRGFNFLFQQRLPQWEFLIK